MNPQRIIGDDVRNLRCSTRTKNGIWAREAETITELLDVTVADLLAIPNFGPACWLDLGTELCRLKLQGTIDRLVEREKERRQAELKPNERLIPWYGGRRP